MVSAFALIVRRPIDRSFAPIGILLANSGCAAEVSDKETLQAVRHEWRRYKKWPASISSHERKGLIPLVLLPVGSSKEAE
jgi:hypothetical protein